jgi:hypothetical protein
MDLGPGESDVDAALPPEWKYEALDDDKDFMAAHKNCYMCERGQDETNGTVVKLQQVLNRHGQISDTSRFLAAGTVQHKMADDDMRTPDACARDLMDHERNHVLETTVINGENLKGLRLVARHLRSQLQRRNLETGDKEVDGKRLDSYMKVLKLQMEILKFKPDGLPFTRRRHLVHEHNSRNPT